MDKLKPKISVITPTIRETGLQTVADGLRNQVFKDFEWLVDINITDKSDLNQSLNKLINRAQGELIVCVQDYIRIPSDGLLLFWQAYENNPRGFYTAPVGKTKDFETVKWDWRIYTDKSDWMRWEIDYGSAPRSALKEIGGFDEKLDEYWGFDNVNAGLRAEMAGYTFHCLPTNKAFAYDHDAFIEHPFRKLRNPDFHNARLDEIRRGLKIDHIK